MKANKGFIQIENIFNSEAVTIITNSFYAEILSTIDSMMHTLFLYGFPCETMEYNPGTDLQRVLAIQAKNSIHTIINTAHAHSLNIEGKALPLSREAAIEIGQLFAEYSKDEILQGLEEMAMVSVMYKWKFDGTPADHNRQVMHPYNMYIKMKKLLSGYTGLSPE